MSERISLMTKRQLKNRIIKKRIAVKKNFYLHWRPRMQKLFFPICFLIFSVACINHWYNNRGVWTFEQAEVVAVAQASEVIETSPVTSENVADYTLDGKPGQESASVTVAAESKGDTNTHLPVSVAAIETIKQVAEEEDVDWKVLLGICLKESNCNTNRIGDGGKSFGAFQMHQGWQPNTKSCAVDLKCSAEWTAKRLKRHEHLGLWDMIRSHNGLVGDRNGDGEVDNAYYPNDVLKIISSL